MSTGSMTFCGVQMASTHQRYPFVAIISKDDPMGPIRVRKLLKELGRHHGITVEWQGGAEASEGPEGADGAGEHAPCQNRRNKDQETK